LAEWGPEGARFGGCGHAAAAEKTKTIASPTTRQ
jgi:hypothetical protein